MRRILWCGFQRALDDLSDLFVRDGTWAARAIFVGQARNTVLRKAIAPFANRMLAVAQNRGYFLVGQAIRTLQDYPAPVRQ
ncbi:hypothetical protein GALL_377150 [mine drainage metagenome]|uniref:Uncharacterized protein n=1 Tax=mine drainage metagenome TaxID=410659 RepID=A0A1J5QBH6_9ZZZZ